MSGIIFYQARSLIRNEEPIKKTQMIISMLRGVDMTQLVKEVSSICVTCVLAAIIAITFITAAVLVWTQLF